MNQNRKNKKKIGKVNPLLYAFLYATLGTVYRIKYHITFDKKIVKQIKGPAIILATHTSDKDHILSGMTLYPIRPTYVVSEHFLHKRDTAGLLKLMHIISKKNVYTRRFYNNEYPSCKKRKCSYCYFC